MFIDVNTWKKENVKERCLKILIKDASYIDDWDQGILNIVLDGRTKYIKEKFLAEEYSLYIEKCCYQTLHWKEETLEIM